MDNYKKSERGGIRVQAPLVDRVVINDLTGDFSLPDYRPEVKRLLRAKATALPIDTYVGVGSAEMSGRVEYSLLYEGNDGGLYCVTHNEELHFSVPVEMSLDFELGNGLVCDVDGVCETVSARVAAPRKLSLRCRVRSRVRILGTRILGEGISTLANDGLERLCDTAQCASLFVGISEPLRLEDEILYDGSDLRVISAEGQAFVSEATAGSGVVNCRGEVSLRFLCLHEGSGAQPFVQTRRLPFSHAVLVDGAEVNCEAVAVGACSEITVTVEEGRFLCEVSVLLRARAQRNETVIYVRDLYSTCCECKPSYMEMTLPCAFRCINANFSINRMLTLEEAGIRVGMTVLELSMTPISQELVCERGKYLITGNCRCQAVLSNGDEHAMSEFDIPFRYEAEGEGAAVGDYDLFMEAIACRARMDGERIGVDAELSVALITRGETRFRFVGSVSMGERFKRGDSLYTICYPSREDTLWSVAKSYGRSIDSIVQINALANAPAADSLESLAGVRYLLV